MYSYVVTELPTVVKSALPMADIARASIMGHSMGGHGALVLGLKNRSAYKVRRIPSAFWFSSRVAYTRM